MKAALTFLLLSAAPALAAGKFVVPEGCEAFVTVQHSDCQVSYHYTCARDPEGDQWAVYAGPDGPYYMSRIDHETRWVESHDLITPESDRLGSEKEPASFTTLLDTGRDDFDFTTISGTGEVRRYAGHDALKGGTVTIDGVTLERTEFALESFGADGSFLHRRSGHQLISRDWRLFFADTEHFENAFGDVEDSTSTPMTFAFPGEKGFLSGTPQFGCDQMMTMLDGQLVPASYRGQP
ncbi:MAG: hypothetical protein R3D56_08275 [Paracoccaceae bacterium]|mgnify:CR=1 FL=1